MPRYLITYLNAAAEHITADLIETLNGQYIAYCSKEAVAWIPATNVRSITRQDDAEQHEATVLLDQVRNIADTWFREGEPGPTRNAGKHLLDILYTPGAGPR
ncbi:hypothetical protein ACF1GW_38795 [Streptomyces achromogenes]|uniref:hypothetical protein n=1 Tax=Streptomyces achromogenes TaxID=67255 RepID=UPI0036FA98BB